MRLAFCLAHIATAAAATTSGCCSSSNISSSGNSNRNVALCFNRFIWPNTADWVATVGEVNAFPYLQEK